MQLVLKRVALIGLTVLATIGCNPDDGSSEGGGDGENIECDAPELCGGVVDFPVNYLGDLEVSGRQVCFFESLRDETDGVLRLGAFGFDGDESETTIRIAGNGEVIVQVREVDPSTGEALEGDPQRCMLRDGADYDACVTGARSYDECVDEALFASCQTIALVDVCD